MYTLKTSHSDNGIINVLIRVNGIVPLLTCVLHQVLNNKTQVEPETTFFFHTLFIQMLTCFVLYLFNQKKANGHVHWILCKHMNYIVWCLNSMIKLYGNTNTSNLQLLVLLPVCDFFFSLSTHASTHTHTHALTLSLSCATQWWVDTVSVCPGLLTAGLQSQRERSPGRWDPRVLPVIPPYAVTELAKGRQANS